MNLLSPQQIADAIQAAAGAGFQSARCTEWAEGAKGRKSKQVWIKLSRESLIPALQGKRIDIINSAMYINPARSEQVDFHVPVRQGQLVELVARVGEVGRSSIQVEVELHAEDALAGTRQLCTRGRFIMIALDAAGRPAAVALPSSALLG